MNYSSPPGLDWYCPPYWISALHDNQPDSGVSRWLTTLRVLCCFELFTTWLLREFDAEKQSSLKWRLFELLEHTKLRIDLLYTCSPIGNVFSDRYSAWTHWCRRNSCEGKECGAVADFWLSLIWLLTFGSLTSLQVNYLHLVGTFKGII